MPIESSARSALSQLFEVSWRSAFRVASLAVATRASPVPAGERVVVVAPHPDDELVGCGGTLLEHRRRGGTTTVVVLTDGGASRRIGRSEEETVAVRRAEAERAAERLAVDELIWLGFPEYGWAVVDAADRLAQILGSHAADVVYAPSRVDGHPVHFAVAEAVAAAITSERVRIHQAQVPLTPTLVNRAFDVSPSWSDLLEAYDAYPSQAGAIRRTLRLRRYDAALYGASVAAEAFWEVTANAYRALHTDEPWPRAFFGAREGAFRDGWAYLKGRDERRRLRRR